VRLTLKGPERSWKDPASETRGRVSSKREGGSRLSRRKTAGINQRQGAIEGQQKHAKGCFCEIAQKKADRANVGCVGGGGVEKEKGKKRAKLSTRRWWSVRSRRTDENWEGAECLERICPLGGLAGMAGWGKPQAEQPKRPTQAQSTRQFPPALRLLRQP
jgi:hypothetical protein